MTLRRVLARYDYRFPKSLIALTPAAPRDSARLLIYRRGTRTPEFDTFSNLGQYLPPRSVIVFNRTKVIPARLTMTKPTGGMVRMLYVDHTATTVRMMTDATVPDGMQLTLTASLSVTVLRHEGKYVIVKPSFPLSSLIRILKRHGSTPLPPYLRHSPLSEAQRKSQYQTVFAKTDGSVAAPTASLHVTTSLIARLKRAGHDIRFVTLHVNLGTFAPVTENHLRTGTLHVEHFDIDQKTKEFLNAAKAAGRPIIAVGTTVVRTLESSVRRPGILSQRTGDTSLFIRPGFRFKFINGMITNFHVPRSSLLMLVAAFIGRERLFRLYRTAIARRFRLFSFGDGMLLL